MVLRDEKERERLARLSKAIREKTTCRIYRNKLQSRKGEREINDSDVYLGLSACNREEACGICSNWECLDRFEEHLTHDEQVEFKHCLISSDARTFKKYQIEVSKMIREREDALQRNIEKEIAEKKRQKEIEEQAKIEAQVQRVMSERIDDFTKGELLEIMNGTEEGQRLVAERKARLDEEMRSAVQMGKNAINTEVDSDGFLLDSDLETEDEQKLETQKVADKASRRLYVFVDSFANLIEPEKMIDIRVRLTLLNAKGKGIESVCCSPNSDCGSVSGDGLLTIRSGVVLKSIPRNWKPGTLLIFELTHYKISTGKMSLKCWSYARADVIEPGTFGYSLERKPVDIDYVKAIISMKPNALQILRPPYNRERGNDLKVSYKLV